MKFIHANKRLYRTQMLRKRRERRFDGKPARLDPQRGVFDPLRHEEQRQLPQERFKRRRVCPVSRMPEHRLFRLVRASHDRAAERAFSDAGKPIH